jgi:hypothetical protein
LIQGPQPGFDYWPVAVVLTIAGVALLLQWTGRVAPLPERHVQVPRYWLQWRRRSTTAAAFGVMLGAGFLTRLKYATAYTLAAILLLAPTVGTGAAIGATYGAGRGMALGCTWFFDSYLGYRLPWERAMHAHRAVARALAFVGAAALTAAIVSRGLA